MGGGGGGVAENKAASGPAETSVRYTPEVPEFSLYN
jgi:hypothetical protein